MKKSEKRSAAKRGRPRQMRRGKARQMQDAMRAIKEVVDRNAADWPKYVGDFFGVWELTAKNVVCVAEQLLQNQAIDFTADLWQTLLSPYSPMHLLRFARIMGHLDLDQEDRYREACVRLDAAWQQFFSTCAVRHVSYQAFFDELAAVRERTQRIVVPLFTGEALPELSPEWAQAYRELETAAAVLAEALRT